MIPSVLLVGEPRDEHCDRLEMQLTRSRLNPKVLRTSLPALSVTTFLWSPTGPLVIGDATIPSKTCSGIMRRPGQPDLSSFDPEYASFVMSEYYDAFHGGLAAAGVAWLTQPSTLIQAEFKLLQLRNAAELNLPLPATVVTNYYDGVEPLGDRDVVVKPVRYGLLTTTNPPRVAYTSATRLAELEGLSGCPVIVQERIRAAFHLRVITIGPDSVFVGVLPADDSLDWRSDEANHTRFRGDLPYPSEVREFASSLARKLDLGLSAQDWVVTPDGEPVFLEANPNGQWLFIDDIFDQAISRRVSDTLLHLATNHALS